MAGNQGFEGVSQFGRAGSAIASERDRAQAHDHFADQRAIQVVSGSGEAGGGGRMSVDDGVYVGTQAVDQEVHADLARDAAFAGQALSFHVNDDHVGGLHPTLADTGGRDEEALGIESDGEIAVGGGDQSVLVQAASELHDCLSVLTMVA